jgi:spermidine synthase
MNNLSKYEMFVPLSYDEIKPVIAANIAPGSTILDLGPYEGNLEEYLESLDQPFNIDAVDIDGDAIKVLAAKTFGNITVNCIHSDGNDFLRDYNQKVDVVLSSASIHELNNPEDQEGYLDWFFGRLQEILVDGGKAIIGDLYFPDHVSDEAVEAFRLFQLNTINHASARNQFIKPELIEAAALTHGFTLVSKKEIRAVKEIDRRYYVIFLQKL